MFLLRIALLVIALGNFGFQAAAAAHPLFRDLGYFNPGKEIMPRLRRPVLDRSERPIRRDASVEGTPSTDRGLVASFARG
jgi:hypothetical protein